MLIGHVQKRTAKGVFFSESAMKLFQISKSQKKKIQKAVLNLKFEFPANNTYYYYYKYYYTVIGGKFKYQAQYSFFGFFFLRFGDLKNESHFLKKSHL